MKKASITAMTLLAFFSTVAPVSATPVAHAATTSTSSTAVANDQSTAELTSQIQKKLNTPATQKLLKDNSTTVTDTATGSTTITVTDSQLRNILSGLGVSQKDLGMLGFLRAAGKNQIKFFGNKKSGNFDIRISTSGLNAIKNLKVAAAVAVVLAFIAGPKIPGVSGKALKASVKRVVNLAIKAHFNYKAGRYFKVRNWKYTGWGYQK